MMIRKPSMWRKLLIMFPIILSLLITACQPVNQTSFETAEQAQQNSAGKLQVDFIDCGQGDATLIRCGESAMLIDAGENDKGTQIQLFLKKQGVTKLDYVIGTHPDSDHIGGLDVILTKFDCQTVMLPEIEKNTSTYRDVISAMKYKNYQNTPPAVGDSYQLGDAEFTIIAPNKDYGEDYNNWSIGLILRYGEVRFLFTGDAEKESEKDILANGIELSCDVYKVGHHGSETSSTEEFLDAANPSAAVISCGRDNPYGHPHTETLNKLRERGIKIYRTDEQGTITAISDGKSITWNCQPVNSEVQKEASPPSGEITYILNTSTKKFHRLTCSGLPSKNRVDTNLSREEILAQGYAPCQICKP